VKRDITVLLDACVLIPMPLADTLLRLAAGPRRYRPDYGFLLSRLRINVPAFVAMIEETLD
jgi:hypothetical protein